jgi:hypothetical protein
MSAIGKRDKTARVTFTMSFDLEFLEKWNETKEIDAEVIRSYLDLPEKANIRGVYVNSVSVKCDNCTELKHISEFPEDVISAGRGCDYCLDCIDNEDVKSHEGHEFKESIYGDDSPEAA